MKRASLKRGSKNPVSKNPKAVARQLQDEWERLLKRHAAPLSLGAKAKGLKTVEVKEAVKSLPVKERPCSLMTTGGSTAKTKPKIYTGTKIIGIATMHKSNMVPIFNEEAAVEVAQMRRN